MTSDKDNGSYANEEGSGARRTIPWQCERTLQWLLAQGLFAGPRRRPCHPALNGSTRAPPPGSLPGQVLPRSSGEIGWPFRTPKYAEGPSRRPRGTPDTLSLEWRPIELLRSLGVGGDSNGKLWRRSLNCHRWLTLNYWLPECQCRGFLNTSRTWRWRRTKRRRNKEGGGAEGEEEDEEHEKEQQKKSSIFFITTYNTNCQTELRVSLRRKNRNTIPH